MFTYMNTRMITKERIILQSPKHFKHYLCKLHAHKRVYNDFQKKLDEFHDLYFQSDTSLLADVFKVFTVYILINYMSLILLNFFFCTKINMVSSLKKKQSKSRAVNWYWCVINGWKSYQSWNMSCYYLTICKS